MPWVPPPPSSYAYGDAIAGWGGQEWGWVEGWKWGSSKHTIGQTALGERGSLSPTSPQVVATANGK